MALGSIDEVLVLTLDEQGHVRSWNRACEIVTGVTASEMCGKPAPLHVDAGSSRFDAPLRTKDGDERWFAWAISREDDARTVVVGIESAARRAHMALCGELEQASEGVMLADADGRFVEVNAKSSEIFGMTRSEVLSMRLVDLVVQEERSRVRVMRERLLQGHDDRGEWRVMRGDGQIAHVEMSARALADGRLLAIVHDISVRKRAEEGRERLLSEAEGERAWLQTIIDAVPMTILLFRPDGRLWFNKKAEELLGMKLSATGGSAQYASRIFHPDGRPVFPGDLPSSRMLSGEAQVGAPFMVQRGDGVSTPVLATAAPILDELGRVIGGVLAAQDMTAVDRAEQQRLESQRLLDGIFEIMPMGIWILDRNGKVVRSNPAGRRIWGSERSFGKASTEEPKGWWVKNGELIAADEWPSARALRHGETTVGEVIRIQVGDGTFKTILSSALPLRDDSGAFVGAVVVKEDITSVLETEEALREAVRARDTTLGIVAHDLRNPLLAISLAAHSIGTRATRDGLEWLQGPTERVLRASRTMTRLIEDLLDLANIDAHRLSIERSTIDPQEVVAEVVVEHRDLAAAKGITMHSATAQGLPLLSADRDRLVQALTNIIGNALKFTPPGGEVTVAAGRQGDVVVFTVRDSGKGIAGQHQKHVFERYWSADPHDRRGRGLGLAIAKGIVEAHGGRIWVESEDGTGTTIFFTVPTAEAARESAAHV